MNNIYAAARDSRNNVRCGVKHNSFKRTQFIFPANVIVHEWGHLRWGLFDEYASIPYPGTTKPNQKIQFYNTKGQWRPAT